MSFGNPPMNFSAVRSDTFEGFAHGFLMGGVWGFVTPSTSKTFYGSLAEVPLAILFRGPDAPRPLPFSTPRSVLPSALAFGGICAASSFFFSASSWMRQSKDGTSSLWSFAGVAGYAAFWFSGSPQRVLLHHTGLSAALISTMLYGVLKEDIDV